MGVLVVVKKIDVAYSTFVDQANKKRHLNHRRRHFHLRYLRYRSYFDVFSGVYEIGRACELVPEF